MSGQVRLLSSKYINAHFRRDDEFRCDLVAFTAHAALLGAFALLCHQVISPAVFMVVGLGAYVRNFNALHEASHARRSSWNPLRWVHMAVMIVHSPFQLGYRELADNHRLHHAFPADLERDPDASLNSGHWYTAAPYASVQPEFAAWGYLRRIGAAQGVARGLHWVLLYNCALTAALIALSGVDYLWWVAVTRVGSTATWFIFDWILHHPLVYALPRLRPLPAVVRWLWAALFSRANLNATCHHALHHAYPSVADNDLPALARLLDEGVGDGASGAAYARDEAPLMRMR